MKSTVLASVAIALFTGGCAVNVPSMGRPGDKPDVRKLRDVELVNHIKCELRLAVQRIRAEATQNTRSGGNSLAWLDNWGFKVNLQMQVSVKSTLSPGISITNVLENAVKVFPENGDVTVGRNSTQTFGATYATDVTRTETVAFFYKFSDLVSKDEAIFDDFGGDTAVPKDPAVCGKIDIVDNDDLQIYDFLHSKMMLAAHPGALPQTEGGSPFDVLSYQVKFIVTQGVTATPSWKLVAIAINPKDALFNGQRIKTNDLTITLGALTKDAAGNATPSKSLDEQHLANLIGRAVSDAIRDPQ